MANINIGGKLHSTATGNVVAGANEILDDVKGKKQSVINQETDAALAGKQAALVSGTNIKTVNGESILGSGNIQAGDPDAIKYSTQTLTDAQKTQARTNIGAYNKPGTGIPATDLASAAQTSLGKADTAYQKPQSGVPKSDLASGVQSSLDLADTAVQAENVGPILPPPETDEFATKTQVTQLEAELGDKQTATLTGSGSLLSATIYGNFKAGMKIRFTEVGTAVFVAGKLIARYDDNTIFATLNTGGQYETTLAQDTDSIIFSLATSNITTAGTVSVECEYGDYLRATHIDESIIKYTDNDRANRAIHQIYIDTSGYTGSYTLTGLKFTLFGYYDTGNDIYFILKNSANNAIATVQVEYDSSFPGYIDETVNGIRFFVACDWNEFINNTPHRIDFNLTDNCFVKGIINKVYDAEKDISDLQDEVSDISEVMEVVSIQKRDDATVYSPGYMNTDGTVASSNGWKYLKLAVTPGQVYTVSSVAGWSARLWILLDSVDSPISYSTDSSAGSLKTETITIPSGCASLVVNARTSVGDAEPSIVLKKNAVNADAVYTGTENIVDYINRVIVGGEHFASLKFTPGQDSFIISPFNTTYNIKTYFNLSRPSSQSGNPCFNFKGVYLVNKETGVETIVHNVGDDITPAQYNNTYIGANHADSDVRKVTSTGHGKTYEDIGSVWTYNGAYFTIVAIIDEDNLLMLGNNTAVYPKFIFDKPVASTTLTHYIGATHTDSIAVSASVSTQFYSSLRVADLSVYADGKKVTADGSFSFKRLEVCENYDVLNPASVLDLIKSGVGTFTENPNPNGFTAADKVARHSIVYEFDGAGEWKIATNFVAYQDINIQYFGFTQMAALPGNNRKFYLPKSLPIDGKDFRQIVDISSDLSSGLHFTNDYWENPLLPPDRFIEYTDNIGVHTGFLFDYGVGGTHRKDNVSEALMLWTNLKAYPHGIDNKITVNGGDVFSAVVWRSYIDRAKINTGGIIATNSVEYAGKCYVYADFNAVGIYEVEVPAYFVGREISVFEKSANLTVLSELANGKILVKVETASPLYGYLVLQIK